MKRHRRGLGFGCRTLLLVVIVCSLSALVVFGRLDGKSQIKRGMLRGVHTAQSVANALSGAVANEDAEMKDWEYRRSLQFEGTGGRMQAFLKKAISGQPFTVSVIGGSVSKGRGLAPTSKGSRLLNRGLPSGADDIFERSESHGLDPMNHLGANTLYSPENMHTIIFEYLNATFPNPGNRFVNGAQGGVGSSYFGWCFKEHIPEDSDLVLVELGINDLQEMNVIQSFEQLIRGVLELKSKPAIVNIETFTTLFPSLLTSASLHLDVLTFYDVPSISIRDILLPRILLHPDEQLPRWFRTGGDVELGDAKVREWGGKAVDLMHISSLGHSLAAGLTIRYIKDQLDTAQQQLQSITSWGRWASSHMRQNSLQILDVPATELTYKFDPLAKQSVKNPQCRSMNSPMLHTAVSGGQGENNLEPGVRGLKPNEGSTGWTLWSWKEKKYLVARTPGALLSIDFITLIDPQSSNNVGGHGERQFASSSGSVHIAYQKSSTYGFGSVECWVDDSTHKKRINGYWDLEARNMGMVTEVSSGLEPGLHTLYCELMKETLDPSGGNEFRLFALMHD